MCAMNIIKAEKTPQDIEKKVLFEKSMVPEFVHSGMGIGHISTFFLLPVWNLFPQQTHFLIANWLTYTTKFLSAINLEEKSEDRSLN